MLKDYKSIVSKNNLYNRFKDRWLFLYHSYIGGKEYRDAGYLTRYASEDNDEYKARCDETPLDNHVASVISVYNSFLYREDPIRELKNIENLTETIGFLNDADLDGRSFNAFMREVSTWSNLFGHAWVMVAKPNINAKTKAEEMAYDIRPYLSLLTPLTVIDWEYDRSPNGRYTLSRFKYVEDVNGQIETIKEWTNEEITTYTVDTEREELVGSPETVPNTLGTIPAVICYSERSIIRGIGNSNVSDIADIQRYIYNAYSESAQSIRLDSHPSLVVTPDTQVGTGSGAIIQVSENLDPGLKPYVLDFAGASIDSILKLIDNAVKSIEKMAHLGGVRATQSSAMSGIALDTEFQLLNAKLATIADNMALAEEHIWRLFCLYQSQQYNVEIYYPNTFSMKDKREELTQMKTITELTQDTMIQDKINVRINEWLDEE